MDELNKDTYLRLSVVFVPDRSCQHDVTVLLSMTSHGCVRLTAQCTTFVAPSDKGSYETKRPPLFRNGLSKNTDLELDVVRKSL